MYICLSVCYFHVKYLVETFLLEFKELKECFESKDIGKLQEVILKMPKEEAEHHMKRCVDSGLWVPNAQEKTGVQEEGGGAEEEETYEDVH